MITVKRIVKTVVAVVPGVTEADVYSTRRHQNICKARHLAEWVARHATDMSYPEIGRALGDRDHTTILSGVRRGAEMLAKDQLWRARAEAVIAILLEETPDAETMGRIAEQRVRFARDTLRNLTARKDAA